MSETQVSRASGEILFLQTAPGEALTGNEFACRYTDRSPGATADSESFVLVLGGEPLSLAAVRATLQGAARPKGLHLYSPVQVKDGVGSYLDVGYGGDNVSGPECDISVALGAQASAFVKAVQNSDGIAPGHAKQLCPIAEKVLLAWSAA